MSKKAPELRKFLAPEFVYGIGALELAGRYAKSLGATNVLLVTDPGVFAAGWTEKVGESLSRAGIPYVIFSGVTPDPKDYEVMAGVEVYTREKCDLILSVGGGSPIDCAKGIGISVGNGQGILEFEGINTIPAPGPPLVCIPTTAGSAADVSQFAIITDSAKKRKIAIISKIIVPDASLVDPQTTTTMSPELTAESGLDALCHAIEAYVSTLSAPVTDVNALEAAGLVARNLAGAYSNPQSISYRDGMMTASLMAGLAFSNASLGLVHAMAHAVGGMFGTAHGEINAILLEYVVRYNFSATPERYARLARVVGIDVGNATPAETLELLVQWMSDFRKSLGITRSLSQLGISEKEIPELARRTIADPCFATNPRPATVRDIETIYENAF